jgi:putative copper export protein
MRLVSVWLHVLGMAVWIGGLTFQSHVLLPHARRAGDPRPFAEAARRGRRVGWAAAGLTVLTGLYNVTGLAPLARVAQSGAGTVLAGKFLLVLAMVALAAQRDFGQVPRLDGAQWRGALRAIRWLDHAVLGLALVVIYLGLVVSRLARGAP